MATIRSVNSTTWVSRGACAQHRVARAWNWYAAAMDRCTRMNVPYESGPARTRFTSLWPILDHVS